MWRIACTHVYVLPSPSVISLSFLRIPWSHAKSARWVRSLAQGVKLSCDPQLVSGVLGAFSSPWLSFRKSSLLYPGGRADGKRTSVGYPPRLEVVPIASVGIDWVVPLGFCHCLVVDCSIIIMDGSTLLSSCILRWNSKYFSINEVTPGIESLVIRDVQSVALVTCKSVAALSLWNGKFPCHHVAQFVTCILLVYILLFRCV